MKNNLLSRKLYQSFGYLLASVLFSLAQPLTAMSQADTTQPAPAATEQELVSPALEFYSVQQGDSAIDLMASLTGKVKGSAFKFYGMKITFYQVVNETDLELGHAITNAAGKALLNIKTDSLKADAEGKVNFKAVFAGNKLMESAEEVSSLKRAKLYITPVKEDSLLNVQVKLVDLSTGSETPVPEATIGIYVRRSFMPLKVGEGTTDENGEATIEFPAKLPGDTQGNLRIFARLEESDVYGKVEAAVLQPWGNPVSDKPEDQPRALWSTHPPIWMLITFIVLMGTVWGHYLVIVYELFRLRKEQPKLPANATNS